MAKAKDLSDKKFSKLTVMEAADRQKGRNVVWKLSCDCKGTAYVDAEKPGMGDVKNCGCGLKRFNHYGRKGEDITGQRFGMLTAVERVNNSASGRTMWLCRCDCGGTKTVCTSELKRGHVKSCGCLKPNLKGIDLKGRRFSRLTALYPTDKRDKNGSIYWHCLCDCGKHKDVSTDNLLTGKTVSCGCRKSEVMKNVHDTLTFVDGTCIDWLKKRKSRSDNTSGLQGVCLLKNGKYKAYIGFKGRNYYLGVFEKLEEAVEVRKEAEALVHDGFVEAYQEYMDFAEEHPGWKEANPFVFEVGMHNGEICITKKTLVPGAGQRNAETDKAAG